MTKLLPASKPSETPAASRPGGRLWVPVLAIAVALLSLAATLLDNRPLGKWDKAVCTAIGKVCTQSDGPDSPSLQNRFKTPVGATFAGQAAVLARHKQRYGET